MSATTPQRSAWTDYAHQEMAAIYTMSSAERMESINKLHRACASRGHGLPEKEVQSIFQYPGGMTEKELELRAALQSFFDKLSVDVLQSHFTYFYKRDQVMERLATVAVSNNSTGQQDCARRSNRVIIDELGKSLLRNGIKPQVPPAAT